MCLGQTKSAEIAGIFLGASNKNRMIGTTFLLGGNNENHEYLAIKIRCQDKSCLKHLKWDPSNNEIVALCVDVGEDIQHFQK